MTFEIENKGGKFLLKAYENNEEVGYISGTFNGSSIDAQHTVVYKEHQGKGYAGKLFNELLRYAKEKGLDIIPTCPYVAKKMKEQE